MRTSQGFVIPTPPHLTGAVYSTPFSPVTTPLHPTSLFAVSGDEEAEERQAKRKTQQLGAAAVLLVGILYDFFVTHHGVGPWDPNYIL
eukprot:CAMPEP_0194274176 /NCGR_PEP_ID=MMETSP0169-20130528/7323_1 /TAXON_ID=218684 /ORGANISM="Corethron pennatum, Strain L29A3" /LENGTH=87 /DNA_ID=CAMNT_0039017301 /DNA_START=60 /DNA_END=323 /DNA_ORIENTATION=-